MTVGTVKRNPYTIHFVNASLVSWGNSSGMKWPEGMTWPLT
jgi:hypothetical protein